MNENSNLYYIINEADLSNEEANPIKKKLPWIKKTTDTLPDDNSAFVDMSKYSKLNTLDDYIKKLKSTSKGDLDRYYVIPINDWIYQVKGKIYNPTNLNPIAALYKYMRNTPNLLKQELKGFKFIFMSNNGYFTMSIDNITNSTHIEFAKLIDEILYLDSKLNTSNLIKADIITGSSGDRANKIINPVKAVKPQPKTGVDKDNINSKKEELVQLVQDISSTSEDEEDVINKMEEDERIRKLLAELEEDENNSININAARSTRMKALNDNFKTISFKDRTVKDIIEKKNITELPSTSLDIDTINDEWKDLKYVNFQKSYDLDADIIKILYSFSNMSYPISIRNVEVEDTSTPMDYIETYTVECEDGFGKRFTLKFDIPKFVNNRFMKLRGNDKVVSGQLLLIPCIKTDNDTAQIVANYNKAFISKFGSVGKSFSSANKIMKVLEKLKNDKETTLKITFGNNSKVCNKYDLPIDYIDISNTISKIETKNSVFAFDQDILRAKYTVKENSFAYGWNKSNPDFAIVFDMTDEQLVDTTFSSILATILSNEDQRFAELYESTKSTEKLSYSKASILNTDIPVIVVIGYAEGLTSVLNKANIKVEFSDKKIRDKIGYDVIVFNDGYLYYKETYESSLLMNGLKECNTENYSYADIDKRTMWLDFLDLFGGRIKADGLDNYKDLLVDPITKETCDRLSIPTDYVELFIYASNLLVDNKYNKHTDISGNRFRTNEIVAGYLYKVLAASYAEYKASNKRGRKVPMTIKRTAVIDAILRDPMASDLSTMTPLLEIESANSVSFKGLSGMNSDRAYSLDKRTYDDSMINKLSLSTGFAGNVGITRQTTIDMNIEGDRGYIKGNDADQMSVTKTFGMTEALTPFGTTRDDPFRSAMTFIQTSKHSMRTKGNAPLLITNGADDAMPYMTSDVFAYKAKDKGKVIELDNNHMILEYTNGDHEYVNLKDQIKKNSDGGIYLTIKLDPDVKLGEKFKSGQIVAHDESSFSNKSGATDDLSYNIGTLAKVAILNSDEGFEDSTIISEWMSEAMTSDVVLLKDISLSKDTNLYEIVEPGQAIQEGEALLLFQNAFDEKDANALLKSITDDSLVSDLGRIRLKSKITGVVQDIKLYRTCPMEELSDSLQKLMKRYEDKIKQEKSTYNKYKIPGANYQLDADYALDKSGKLKNVDGVLVEIYLKYEDKLSVGDKNVAQSAAKGVVKDIFPAGKEPFSEYRPEEKIHGMYSIGSFNARMITSVLISGAINKAMVELDRSVKDIMGLPVKTIEEIQLPKNKK